MKEEEIVELIKNNYELLKEIKENLNIIINKLNKIDNSCNGMDEHISFIMKVYQSLINPINMISKFSYSKLFINN